MECRHSLETHIMADWGTGRTLAEIGQDCDSDGKLLKDLPMKQKESSANGIRRCTLLLIILYYSPFGDTMLNTLLPHARAHHVWNYSILHLEFVLCEIRKACCKGRTKQYTNVVLSFPTRKVITPDWP